MRYSTLQLPLPLTLLSLSLSCLGILPNICLADLPNNNGIPSGPLTVNINSSSTLPVMVKNIPLPVRIDKNDSMDNLIAGYGINQQNYLNITKLNNPTPSSQMGFNLSEILLQLPPNNENNIKQITLLTLQNNLKELAPKDLNKQQLMLSVCIPGSDSYDNMNANNLYKTYCADLPAAYLSTKSNGTPDYRKDIALNANTLLLPMAYPINYGDGSAPADSLPQSYQPSLDFIQYTLMGAQPTPPDILDNFPTDLNDRSKFKPEDKKALIDYRSHVAAISIAISNFYHSYVERIPSIKNERIIQTDPNHSTAVPLIDIKDKDGKTKILLSPMEIENHVATSRARSQKWHDAMEKQPPVILQREQLFIAADQLYETHQLRMEIERMNATMSTLLIQQQAQAQGLNTALKPPGQ